MDANAKFAGLARDENDLLGLRVSAGLLVALGCLWCLYAVFFAVILGVEGVRAWRGQLHNPSDAHWFLTSFLLVILMCALTWLCIRAARALREARRWGAYVAMVFGLLLLLLPATSSTTCTTQSGKAPTRALGYSLCLSC